MKIIVFGYAFLLTATVFAGEVKFQFCHAKTGAVSEVRLTNKVVIKAPSFTLEGKILSRKPFKYEDLDITYQNALRQSLKLYGILNGERVYFNSEFGSKIELLIVRSYDPHSTPNEDFAASLAYEQTGTYVLGRTSECPIR